MSSLVDEGNGLVKTVWQAIRERVSTVEPTFTQLVDELNPNKDFPIYLAYFPFGALKGDIESSFIPKQDGGFYRLNDPNAPKEIIKHLGYGMNSSPFGMVLEKEFEYFIDLKDEQITIPWNIYSPGSFFAFPRNINNKERKNYVPNGILTVTSGARSIFMLPNIGCNLKHTNLQRDFNVRSPTPKNLYQHWYIFKEIIDYDFKQHNWRSCLIYFSENWINKIHNDKSWSSLKIYLLEKAWNSFEYKRCNVYYDIIFSNIQKKRNLKPNPYLADTAFHLITTAFGEAPGYAPACNSNAGPIDNIQNAYVYSYGIKKYMPTIMKPEILNRNDHTMIYYSLQNPSTFSFSPKSRQSINTLVELRELVHIMKIFIEELTKNDSMCTGTDLHKLSNLFEFNYFHNKNDRHQLIKSSQELPQRDTRFSSIKSKYKMPNATFASDAPFVRGCVSINKKNQ